MLKVASSYLSSKKGGELGYPPLAVLSDVATFLTSLSTILFGRARGHDPAVSLFCSLFESECPWLGGRTKNRELAV